MNIGIVGLGLIGGSFCKAIKEFTDNSVLAYDADPEVMYKAFCDGSIDGILSEATFKTLDILFLALYPKSTVEFIENNYMHFPKKLLVCDLCGVKKYVCDYAFEKATSCGFTFIGAHPMAGKEFSGYNNSDAELFKNAFLILTPPEGTDEKIIKELSAFAKSIGFKSCKISNPSEHDKVIACTSQLAHVVSSAYVKSKTASSFKGFSAGSFADMTRVAKLNENMWTELFFENRDNLLHEIDNLIDNLTDYRTALSENSYSRCMELLRGGRILKEKFLNEEASD